MIELVAAGVGGALKVVKGPQPQGHGRGQSACSGSGPLAGNTAHLLDPGAELGQEDLAGHGDRQLTPLHGLRPFVGRLQLRVHPLVGQEAGAILGDAVAAHQADGLAQHVGAVACIP